VSLAYRLTPAARADLDEIVSFVADDNAEAGLRVLDAFEQAFELLGNKPEIGHVREDLTRRPVKFWNVHSYLVVYDPASAPLTVIAVLHGARSVDRILKDAE